MIRTKCPHCGKLLGVNDTAAGSVAVCPACKQKFRIPGAKAAGEAAANAPAPGPAKAPAKPAAPEFPAVEVDEEATQRRAARLSSQRRAAEDDEEVAELDYVDEVEEDEDEPKPRKGSAKKKKKRGRGQDADAMVMRNRIVGSVGALGGVALVVIGVGGKVFDWLPASIADPEHSHLGTAAAYTWLGATLFGVVMTLVGVFYIVKPADGS